MGKNKQQAATEARTRKATPEVAEPTVAVEQPKPNGKADAKTIAAATPSKQDATIEKLKAGWLAKGVNLDRMQIKDAHDQEVEATQLTVLMDGGLLSRFNLTSSA
jgi:hypothetical protein